MQLQLLLFLTILTQSSCWLLGGVRTRSLWTQRERARERVKVTGALRMTRSPSWQIHTNSDPHGNTDNESDRESLSLSLPCFPEEERAFSILENMTFPSASGTIDPVSGEPQYTEEEVKAFLHSLAAQSNPEVLNSTDFPEREPWDDFFSAKQRKSGLGDNYEMGYRTFLQYPVIQQWMEMGRTNRETVRFMWKGVYGELTTKIDREEGFDLVNMVFDCEDPEEILELRHWYRDLLRDKYSKEDKEKENKKEKEREAKQQSECTSAVPHTDTNTHTDTQRDMKEAQAQAQTQTQTQTGTEPQRGLGLEDYLSTPEAQNLLEDKAASLQDVEKLWRRVSKREDVSALLTEDQFVNFNRFLLMFIDGEEF